MNLAPVQCLYVGIYEYFRQIFAPACPKEMSEMTDCNAPQLQMPHSFTVIYCSICIGYRPIDPTHNSDLITDIPCIPLPSPLPATPPHSQIILPSSFFRSFPRTDRRTEGGRVGADDCGNRSWMAWGGRCLLARLPPPPPHLGRRRRAAAAAVLS